MRDLHRLTPHHREVWVIPPPMYVLPDGIGMKHVIERHGRDEQKPEPRHAHRRPFWHGRQGPLAFVLLCLRLASTRAAVPPRTRARPAQSDNLPDVLVACDDVPATKLIGWPGATRYWVDIAPGHVTMNAANQADTYILDQPVSGTTYTWTLARSATEYTIWVSPQANVLGSGWLTGPHSAGETVTIP